MLSFSVWIAAPQNEVRLNHVSSFFFNFYLLKGLENEKTLFFCCTIYGAYLNLRRHRSSTPMLQMESWDGWPMLLNPSSVSHVRQSRIIYTLMTMNNSAPKRLDIISQYRKAICTELIYII